ncbi:MAG TPA: T9SS type B sorting domain-containing protein, partial [Crocinitomix sp.]|nr:T9SS type B sorting domain-containing protein [Crocinitomix sp.]
GTVTYTVTADLASCISTDQVDVTVNPLDDPSFSYPANSYCTSEPNPIATITGTAGGNFSFTATSGGPNLSIDPSTGLINLLASNPGTYDITYTTPGVCPLSSTITMNIALTPTVNTVTDQTVCHGNNFTFINFTGTAGTAFDWVNDNTTIGLAASGTGDIPTFTGVNTSGIQQIANITVTPSAGSCVGSPTSFTLTVNPLDNSGFNYNPTAYCTTDVNPTPTIDVAGGIFTYFTTNGTGTISLDANTGVIDLSLSNAGSYDITYTTPGPDCPQDSTINITINPTPTVDPVIDQTICEGSTFTLIDFTGNDNPTFSWNNDNPNIGLPSSGTGDIASFVGLTTGGNEVANITVTPSTSTCTGTPTSFVLTVQPLDNPGFSYGQTAYCTTDTDPTPTIDVTGGTFTSSDPNLVIDPSTGVIDLSNSAEGTYNITYTTSGPCVQDSTVSITINLTPTVDPVLPQTVCDNTNGDFTDFSPINFTGTSGALSTTYDWVNSNTNIGLAANGQGDIAGFTGTNNTNSAITGTITVTPSTTECIGTPITFDLTVNPIDDPSFQYDAGLTYCTTGSVDPTVTITGTTGGTFSYIVNSGGPNLVLNVTTGTVDLSASDVGSYDITYTTNGLCQQSSTLTLVITSAPVADFTLGVYCANDSDPLPTYINGGSGGIFTSTAGLVINSTTGLVDLDASTPGTYTVTNTIDLTSQGCALSIATDDITINEIPTISITGGTTICPNDPLPDLTVTFTNTSNGPFNFNYTLNGGAVITINTVNSPYTLIPSGLGDYQVISVTDGNGCMNTGNQITTIDTYPTPTINAVQNYEVCDGNNLIIPAFTGTPANNTYNWTVISGSDIGFGTSGMGTIGLFTAINPSTSTIEVTPTSTNGCVGLPITFDVTVNPLPIAEFSAPDTAGCEPFTVTFTSVADFTQKCFWDFGDGATADGCGTVSHTYTTSGTFDVTLTVLSPDSCVTTLVKPGYINVTPTPVAGFTFTPQVTDISHTEIEFINSSVDADTYVWDFGDDSPLNNEEDPIYTYDDVPGQYVITLIASNNNGICADTVQSTITIYDILIYYVPNVFTPDNDAYNQTFQPIFTSGYDIYDYHLMIFNRWGELIFESYDASIGWDGTYPENGELCQDGVYVWKIDFKESMTDKRHNVTGHVTLLK